MAAVGFEQAGAAGQVAGLEETDHHGEQREAARIGDGPGNQAEHLDLGLDRRAVVGQHVDPVVLAEVGRGAARHAGEDEAPCPVEVEHPTAERSFAARLERGPSSEEGGVVHVQLPRGVERPPGVERVVPVLAGTPVAVALEVDERQAEIARGAILGDVDHRVVDAEELGDSGDPVGHVGRDRHEDQLAEQDHLQDPGPELQVPPAQLGGEVVRRQRFDGSRIDREPGHRVRDRRDEDLLQMGQARGTGDGAEESSCQGADLRLIRTVEVDVVGAGQRYDHVCYPVIS
jgi:hypothetical protein